MKIQELRKLIREEVSRALTENSDPIFRQMSDKEKEFAISVLTLLRDRGDFKDLKIPGGFSLTTLEQIIRNITKGRYGMGDIIKQHITWNPVKLSNAIFNLIKKHNETNS